MVHFSNNQSTISTITKINQIDNSFNNDKSEQISLKNESKSVRSTAQ